MRLFRTIIKCDHISLRKHLQETFPALIAALQLTILRLANFIIVWMADAHYCVLHSQLMPVTYLDDLTDEN